MNAITKQCVVCSAPSASYCCPLCNLTSCSLSCYRGHSAGCVERFNQRQQQEKINSNKVDRYDLTTIQAIMDRDAEASEVPAISSSGRDEQGRRLNERNFINTGENEEIIQNTQTTQKQQTTGAVKSNPPAIDESSPAFQSFSSSFSLSFSAHVSALKAKAKNGETIHISELEEQFGLKQEFLNDLKSGKLAHLVGKFSYFPWWAPRAPIAAAAVDDEGQWRPQHIIIKEIEIIQETEAKQEDEEDATDADLESSSSLLAVPSLPCGLPRLSSLLPGPPSPLLAFHALDLLYAYCFTMRLFAGDHASEPVDFCQTLLLLSSVLNDAGRRLRLGHANEEAVPPTALNGAAITMDYSIKLAGHPSIAAAPLFRLLIVKDVAHCFLNGSPCVLRAIGHMEKMFKEILKLPPPNEDGEGDDISDSGSALPASLRPLIVLLVRKLYFFVVWAHDDAHGLAALERSGIKEAIVEELMEYHDKRVMEESIIEQEKQNEIHRSPLIVD